MDEYDQEQLDALLRPYRYRAMRQLVRLVTSYGPEPAEPAVALEMEEWIDCLCALDGVSITSPETLSELIEKHDPADTPDALQKEAYAVWNAWERQRQEEK